MSDQWLVAGYAGPPLWVPGADGRPPLIGDVGGPAQPIIKVPVVGPEPFNTLAIVRGRGGIGEFGIADGEIDRVSSTVWTRLVLPTFDPSRPVSEQIKHSSTASLLCMSSRAQLGPENDAGSEFTVAIDTIRADPAMTETGQFGLVVNTASSHYQTTSMSFLETSSWVLYYDPETVAPGRTSIRIPMNIPERPRIRIKPDLFTPPK